MAVHPNQFTGPRWAIAYGSLDGVERQALIALQRGVQAHLPYLLAVEPVDAVDPAAAEHLVLLGTAANNPHIAELAARGTVALPDRAEGYTLALLDSPWRAGMRVLAVIGADAQGVLYGAVEWNARVLGRRPGASPELDGPAAVRAWFDAQPDFAVTEAPAVPRRGLWTWGYVIYDYRRYLDSMLRLKLNTLIVWNDAPPLNAAELLDYAHARGIEVTFGFPWGWGFDDELSLAKAEDRARITAGVLAHYRTHYAHLPHDGLYFQTLTEHATQEIDGRSVAAWACELVNDTARALWAEYPGVPIQFGLHATSIRAHYTDLRALDPGVTITWEDAGVLPYGYFPTLEHDGETFEHTLAYSRALATFRPGTPFALVPKGWMCLRWGVDFEHHGPFILGERDAGFIRRRRAQRQPEWAPVNEAWLRLYPHAMRFYREMLAVNPDLHATGLVEDGLFEEAIQPSVALFAETLWNPYADERDLLARATRPYYGG